MLIHPLSDLHLESSGISAVSSTADVIVLAGDISVRPALLVELIERKLPDNIPVVTVLGNHEHEYRHIKMAHLFYKDLLAEFPHVTILNNEHLVIKDTLFVGSTLWSNFEGEGLLCKEATMAWAQQIQDFKSIKNDHDYVTPAEMAKISEQARAYLKATLTDPQFAKLKKVVVTHFAPCLESRDLSYGDTRGSAYWVNNMPDLMGLSDLHIHGHTHRSLDYVKNGTRVICNARGSSQTYDLAQNLGFRKDLIVEI